MTPYVYVAVRSDLTSAQQLVQAAHATQESGAQFGCPEHCHMVVFEVNGIEGLKKFCEVCGNAGIQYSLFYEPDYDLGYTAACTEPIMGQARSHFRRFQLFGGQTLAQQDMLSRQPA
jgi:hypothetical protein